MKRFACVLLLLPVLGCAREEPQGAAMARSVPVVTAPVGSAPGPVKEDVFVIIDKSGIRLSTDAAVLVPPPTGSGRGADEAYKRQGPNDLYLVPLATALNKLQEAKRIVLPLRVMVGKDIGYRVLIEALFTAGQHEIGEFELCEEQCGPRSLTFRPPRAGDLRRLPEQRSLNFSALIVTDGIALKTSFGNIAPGCESGAGAGLAIPKKNGAHDLSALAACAQKLEAQDPAFAAEEDVIISATDNVPFSEVMDVALTLQGPTKSLFSRVTFGVAK